MEQLALLTDRKRKSAERLKRNSKIIKTIINAIREKKGENIVSLDLRKIHEAVADFLSFAKQETSRRSGPSQGLSKSR